MQFSASSIISLLPFFGLASAGCFSGGAPWPDDHGGVIAAIQAAAYSMESIGDVYPGEHTYDARVADKMLHFILDNISGQVKTITTDEAIDGFTKEYRGCDHGGDSSYTTWRYVLDPNEL